MKKGLVLSVGLILMISMLGFVVAEMTSQTDDNYLIEVEIVEGWNLVLPFDFDDTTEDSEITKSDIIVAYFLDHVRKEYLRVYPESEEYSYYTSNLAMEELTYFSFASIWIYSDKAGTLKYYRSDVPKYNEVALEDGWNFMTFTPEMSGKTMNEIKGSCDIEDAYIWNYLGQSWSDELSPKKTSNSLDKPLDDDFEGYGFIIKVSEDCALGESSSGGTVPPSLP